MQTWGRLITALALGGALMACEETQPIVGSDNVFVLPNLVFTIQERVIADNALVARGTISNQGDTKYTPVWYVEAEFYRDDGFTYKLGGANQSISFTLAKGEETGWELKLRSYDFDVNQFPKFAIKNLRAIRPK